MTEPETTEDLLVQYVLGELPAVDARAIEQRIAAEPALGDEVRRLRAAFDLVGYGAAATPPPNLRDRIVRAAAASDGARTAAPARRIVWSRFVAAAAAAIALAVGINDFRLRRELAIERSLTAMLQEPNVVRTFTLAGAGTAGDAFGRVALDLDAKKGAVVLRRLAPLPPGQVYRLWARVGDKDVPCGQFAADARGAVVSQFAVPVESYTAPIAKLFVTIEPATPAAGPTGPTVMESI